MKNIKNTIDPLIGREIKVGNATFSISSGFLIRNYIEPSLLSEEKSIELVQYIVTRRLRLIYLNNRVI